MSQYLLINDLISSRTIEKHHVGSVHRPIDQTVVLEVKISKMQPQNSLEEYYE